IIGTFSFFILLPQSVEEGLRVTIKIYLNIIADRISRPYSYHCICSKPFLRDNFIEHCICIVEKTSRLFPYNIILKYIRIFTCQLPGAEEWCPVYVLPYLIE